LRKDVGGPELDAWRTSAKWLVDALEQRRTTLLAVTSSIMRAQRDFLAGTAPLQPLVLRDVAAELGCHESTVSRAVAEKYVQTAQGVLPLKAFFARRVTSRDDTTAAEVKDRISAIVAGEDGSRPCSDDEIARRLAREGLGVSRRTVAKYREELGLPVAAVRRSASYRDGATLS
jgi:RNA polymerase sigma-54 factor